MITHTFKLKDLWVYHASPVRRHEEGKTGLQPLGGGKDPPPPFKLKVLMAPTCLTYKEKQ